MQGMQVAAEPLSAPPYATECAMTLDGTTFTSCRKVKLFDSNLEKQLQLVLSCHLLMPGSIKFTKRQ